MDGTTAADGSPRISGALLETITTAQTEAVATLVKADFDLALRIALAGLRSNDWSSPAKITVTNQARESEDRQRRVVFEAAWPRVAAMTTGEVMAEFARAIAGALNLAEVHNQSSCRAGRKALVASLPAEKYALWMREAFLPADYFKRASKDVAIAALEEMEEAGCIGSLSADLSDAKKADLAQMAAEAAKACGWLPPELRHPAYRLDTQTPSKEHAA